MKADGWNVDKNDIHWIMCNANCKRRINLLPPSSSCSSDAPSYYPATYVVVHQDMQMPFCTLQCAIKKLVDMI